ncbi:DUF1648 domain-containing protein [Lentibacillus sediminis]|uniref:DUF1648 domain-containing protein n=1 Tax=Lentibacillus sediminis TaxID=1940529 RepID=UPI000C1BF26B|nr:DUF1648 domain-containing protein [Lentibacillus sediminis]
MKKQPDIEVPASVLEKFLHITAFAVIIGMFVYAAVMVGRLPDEIPIHFNAAGEADNWGGKGAIFMLPLISLPMSLILFFLGRAPHIHNYPFKVTEENASKLYRESRLMMAAMHLMVTGIFALITWQMVESAQGNAWLGLWLTVIITAAPLALIGYFLIRMFRLKN